jgi:hypothetical protein
VVSSALRALTEQHATHFREREGIDQLGRNKLPTGRPAAALQRGEDFLGTMKEGFATPMGAVVRDL